MYTVLICVVLFSTKRWSATAVCYTESAIENVCYSEILATATKYNIHCLDSLLVRLGTAYGKHLPTLL